MRKESILIESSPAPMPTGMSVLTTTSEDNISSEFDKVMSKVKAKPDKSREKQKSALVEQVEEDTNSTLEININDHLQTQTPSIDDEMDIKFEASGIESNLTLTPSPEDDLNFETDLTHDWKLNKHVECRVTLVRLRNNPSGNEFKRHERVSIPHAQSHQSGVDESKGSKDIPTFQFDSVGSKVMVKLDESVEEQESTVPCHQDEQEQQDPNSTVGQEIRRDPLQIGIPSIDDEIDIKYEVHNWALNGDNDIDLDNGDELPEMNPKPTQRDASRESEQIELNQLYIDLLQCERDCGTCQKYIRKLREHLRYAHATAQPTSDPLHIDPLEMGQSSFIEIKCEEDKDIENMDCSEETESDPDFDGECSRDGDSDPDDSASTHSTRNATRRNVVKEKGSTEPEFSNQRTLTLRADIQAQAGDKQFTCNTCGEGFVSKYRLSMHERTHIGEVPNTCEICGKCFTRRRNLIAHMRIHTGEKPFNCTVCGKCFTRKSGLEAHMICHTGVKPFKCEQCAKNFTTRNHLTLHLRTHTGAKPFKCDQCKESFSLKWNLQRHMRSHTGEKAFKCTVCGKCFSQKSYLEVHMICHTGVKSFKCKQCAKSFARQHHLTRHMRNHTGEQPFNCETCGKSFGRKDVLATHMRYHTGENLFKCSECEVSFTNSSHLSRHKKNNHKRFTK